MNMKIKQTIFAIVMMIGIIIVPLSVSTSAASCGGVETSVIDCSQQKAVCPAGTTGPGEDGLCSDKSHPVYKSITDSGIWGILITAINILTAGVAITAVGGVIYGSILYTSAEGSADQTKKARTIIANVMIGLLAYGLMYGFLNFIVPGGMFN